MKLCRNLLCNSLKKPFQKSLYVTTFTQPHHSVAVYYLHLTISLLSLIIPHFIMFMFFSLVCRKRLELLHSVQLILVCHLLLYFFLFLKHFIVHGDSVEMLCAIVCFVFCCTESRGFSWFP